MKPRWRDPRDRPPGASFRRSSGVRNPPGGGGGYSVFDDTAAVATYPERHMKTTSLRNAALGLALILAFASQAEAAPASRASVEALFALQHADTMIDRVYDVMQKSMSQMLAQNGGQGAASPMRQRIEAKAMDDTMALVRAEYNWAVIEPDMIDAYQKTFTEDEITGMINFYASPAGQAMTAKMPQLMQVTMAASQVRMQALLPRIQAISEKARADADAAAAAH